MHPGIMLSFTQTAHSEQWCHAIGGRRLSKIFGYNFFLIKKKTFITDRII